MTDGEEADSQLAGPASTSTRDHGFAPESRAGGHLIAFIRYQRKDHPPMVPCTCGATIHADTDELLVPAFTRHRRVEIGAGRAETMVKTRVDADGSNMHYRLELASGAARPKPVPADQTTVLEKRHGWDRAPARPLDRHKLAGRLV